MAANIDALDRMMPRAVRYFWRARKAAAARQKKRGISDHGNRSGVTAGKNLDGFIALARRIILDNGIRDVSVHTEKRADVTIPGFYRPTKNWDLLVVDKDRLLAAIEFKSQVGPSFGNNFNNRVEEALGNATDLNTAFREGAFGDSPKPFVGYFFVLEECTESTRPVRFSSPHFPALAEFENTSYAARYEILCRKLIQERLYDAATLVLVPSSGSRSGEYHSAGELTSARRFVAALAGKVAAMAIE